MRIQRAQNSHEFCYGRFRSVAGLGGSVYLVFKKMQRMVGEKQIFRNAFALVALNCTTSKLVKLLCLTLACASCYCFFLEAGQLNAQEPVFSGPQPNEPIVPFQIRSLTEPDLGKQIDYVSKAKGKPLLLIFVHDLNRQSISLVRNLTTYSAGRASDGLETGVILLQDDANESEKNFQRMKHAFNAETATGVSLEGREGPGSYGLNRLVTLTILLSKEDKVVANYALVQPSLQVDLPKIVKSITEVVGGVVPPLEELIGKDAMRAMQSDRKDKTPDMSGIMRSLIQKSASEEKVIQVAAEIEKQMDGDDAVRKEVYRIATAVTGGGKLSDYGIPKAQEFLTKWANESREKSGTQPRSGKAKKE